MSTLPTRLVGVSFHMLGIFAVSRVLRVFLSSYNLLSSLTTPQSSRMKEAERKRGEEDLEIVNNCSHLIWSDLSHVAAREAGK